MSRSPWAWPPEQAIEEPLCARGVAEKDAPAIALEQAIQKLGTMQALADALGISIQAVSQWKRVPHLRVLDIERITGIPRHELRADIYPPPVASSSHGEARP